MHAPVHDCLIILLKWWLVCVLIFRLTPPVLICTTCSRAQYTLHRAHSGTLYTGTLYTAHTLHRAHFTQAHFTQHTLYTEHIQAHFTQHTLYTELTQAHFTQHTLYTELTQAHCTQHTQAYITQSAWHKKCCRHVCNDIFVNNPMGSLVQTNEHGVILSYHSPVTYHTCPTHISSCLNLVICG